MVETLDDQAGSLHQRDDLTALLLSVDPHTPAERNASLYS
jgi:hypothetical protein